MITSAINPIVYGVSMVAFVHLNLCVNPPPPPLPKIPTTTAIDIKLGMHNH